MWSDKLTSYNGQAISYDSAGNPTSYKGAALTWNGRLLMSYEKNGVKYTYTYNESGLRTSKTKYEYNVKKFEETYIWSGDRLVAMKKQETANGLTAVISYLYDSNDEVYGFTYNNKTYIYVKTIQGDVGGIINATDNIACIGMIYDAWGNVTYDYNEELDSLGNLEAMIVASMNSIMYRGYFYDVETGLYYLQSRYYDPETGRFINADDTAYIGYDSSPISTNIFAYCANNPVRNSDYNGKWYITYTNYIFVYDRNGRDFKKQAQWMAKYAYDNKNVKYIYLDKISEFKNEWNKLKNKYINDIHLFFHGGADVLYFYKETMKGREIEKLSKINIKGKLYLFSCKGGTDKSRNSVAGRFAKLINGKPVRAVVNGSVYYRSATQLFSYKPLTKEKGAYWADLNI